MSIAVEWERASRIPFARAEQDATFGASGLLTNAIWCVQAGVLAFFVLYLLASPAAGAASVVAAFVGGAASFWPAVLATIALVCPMVAAGGAAVLVRRDGGSLPLAAAAFAGIVLIVGMAEVGVTAMAILFLGS